MWVDGTALVRDGGPLPENLRAESVAAACGGYRQPLAGTVVITGAANAAGEVVGLDTAHLLSLTEAMADMAVIARNAERELKLRDQLGEAIDCGDKPAVQAIVTELARLSLEAGLDAFLTVLARRTDKW